MPVDLKISQRAADVQRVTVRFGGILRGPKGPALSFTLTVAATNVIALTSLAVPGIVRPDRLPLFWAACLTLTVALVAVVVALIRTGSVGDTVHVVALAWIVGGVALILCVGDPPTLALSAGWFGIVPMFLSTLLGRRMVAFYGLLCAACAVLLVSTLPGKPAMVLIRDVVVVGLVVLPISYFLVLRGDLDQALEAARRQACNDPLTGLLNRRGLEERYTILADHGARRTLHVAMLVCDVDHFKRVNDTLGHVVGDIVLQRIAETLLRYVRPGDIVARLGGEELAVVGQVSDPAEAGVLADRLRRQIQRDCEEWQVTVSFGIVTATVTNRQDPAAELAGLMIASDHWLYEAKAAGRNCVRGPDQTLAGTHT